MIYRLVVVVILLFNMVNASNATEPQPALTLGAPNSDLMTLRGIVVERDMPRFASFSLLGDTWISLGVDDVRSRIRSRMYLLYATYGQSMPRVGEVCGFNFHYEAIEGIVGDGGSAKIPTAMVLDSFKCRARTKKRNKG